VLARIHERLFVVLLLLASMQVVTALTARSVDRGDPGVVSTDVHMSSVAIEAGLYLIGAPLVLKRWRRVLQASRAVWPLIGLTALAPLSLAWSIHPILTLRRGALVVASTMFAIYLGERYSIENFARLLAKTFSLMMLVVVALFFIAPSYVVDYSVHGGAWKGLSAYKNTFGEYMGVAVIILLLVKFRHFRWLRYVFLICAVAMLALSHSATAIACCVLSIAIMPLWRVTYVKGKQRWLAYTITIIVLLLAGVFAWSDTDLLFRIMGRDRTLTGRTQLWTAVLPAIWKHPFLGYGYGAFWTGLKGEALNIWIGLGSGWVAPLADNGYIDLCLALGLLGVFTFLLLLVHCVKNGISYLNSETQRIGLWPMTYLFFFVLHNFSESTLLTPGSFPFLLFATISTSVALNRRCASAQTNLRISEVTRLRSRQQLARSGVAKIY
jgi:exopolysaccharide production protein ExoQ